jgi:hypothetical protein
MKRLLIIPLLLLPCALARGQAASPAVSAAVESIAPCLVQGLPDDWTRIYMVIDLARPGDASGNVRYLVSRRDTPDQVEPYTPCDIRAPALTLLATRAQQGPERNGWTGARLVLRPSGNFELNYDYPE